MTESAFQATLVAMPGVTAIIAADYPHFTVLACTQEYAKLAKSSPELLRGRPLLEPFPESHELRGKAQKHLHNSLRKVMDTGQEDIMAMQRYDIETNGKFEERYWRITNRPIFDVDGNLTGIVHAPQDITFEVLGKRREKQIEVFEMAFDLFMDAPQAIGIVSGEKLTIELANRTLLNLLCTDDQIIGKPLLEALEDEKSHALGEILNRVIREGTAFEDTQIPVKLLCGRVSELHYFHIRCQPFFERNDKQASGVLFYAHDVTDKVEAIEKLREKQERYRTLIEEAPIATALYIGPELKIQYINDLMLKYWGKDHSVRGMIFSKALPEVADQPFPKQLLEVYRTGRDFIGLGSEAHLVIDGKPKKSYFNYTYKALRDANGNVYGIHHTAIDVTQQVTDQLNLESSERKFRELSQSLEEKVLQRTFMVSQLNETFRHAERTGKFGSYRYNLKTGQLSYSENLYRMLGVDIESFKPTIQDFMGFVHPDDRESVQNDADQYFLRGEPCVNEFRITTSGGEIICVRSSTNRITASDGQDYVIGTLQDITQEKTRERQLTENNAKLVEMNRELESFAYISSHDLQEPLRKIQTFASRIIEEEHDNLSQRTGTYFERIMNAAHRMQILIDDLLSYSRTNVEDRTFEHVHLSKLINETSEEVAEDLHVYQALIETGPVDFVTVIPFQFRQLLHNLIGNALKFSRPEKRPHIYISSESGTGAELNVPDLDPEIRYTHIRFSDNGIGFPPEFAGKIFEVFQRLHTREKYSGTGIGLAIVRKIVENHDGIITAKGEPNKGATFDIYIPERQIQTNENEQEKLPNYN